MSRTKRPSGGIALAVKKSIAKYVTILISSDSNLVPWFKLSKQISDCEGDILYGVVDIPPEYTKYASPDPFIEIQNELENLSIILAKFCCFAISMPERGSLMILLSLTLFYLKNYN